ncbi:sodium/potassium-transporting ATPase subunit alpha [Acrasis kona]|uniref:Sodium/potassium-transporting ATPase subunit alpha n=1 Tax=Acrasis kona TaxID=1008807 RepID=A0AAW2ZIV8_9EUKA
MENGASKELESLDKEPAPARHEATQFHPTISNRAVTNSQLNTAFKQRKASIMVYKHQQQNRLVVQDAALPPVLTVDNKVETAEEVVPDIKKDLEIDYHAVDLKVLESRFSTSAELGLTQSSASSKLRKNGPNTISVGNRFEKVFKIIGYLFGGFGLIIWPAAILSILAYAPIGDPPDKANLGVGLVLIGSMLLTAFFSGWQDFQSSSVMNTIGGMLPSEAQVIRDSTKKFVLVSELVVGDLIQIENGTKVPADLRLVQNSSLKVDNSILTGESEPITCTIKCTCEENFMESKNILFMGTGIVEGGGIGMVVATGNNTMMGKIAKMATKSTAMTPIQKEIYRFMIIICCAGFLTAIATVLFWAFFLRVYKPGFMNNGAIVIALIASLTAFLPNGLPISVSLTFTVMAQRMFKKNVLVKLLPTVETLGSIDTIASDKTGTLTQNIMSVLHLVNGMRMLELGDETRRLFELKDKAFTELVRICAVCNRAVFDEKTKDLPTSQRVIIGDASDTGIMKFAEEYIRVEPARLQYPKLLEIPFNSKNKWMLNIWNMDGKVTLLQKGAAEIIMNKCSTIMMPDGSIEPLTEDKRKQLQTMQEGLAGNGERVLGCCRNVLDLPVDYKYTVEPYNFPQDGHCFVGMMSLIDPPREDVPGAVELCRKASIRVMMVTGDHPATATAIARMVGIVTKKSVVEVVDQYSLSDQDSLDTCKNRCITIRGSNIDNFDEPTWDNILKHDEIVWARTSPENKLQIVLECQKRKHIVAVTGDGVNDAPALKQANVGVAMGSGSEVAREAASIVLTDSKFSSIVAGIENGRMVFDNMKKVVLYLLPAGTFAELLPFFANVYFGVPIMLSAFLMIMIALGTDIAPSLAMIYEQAEADLMDRMPRSRTGEKMVNLRLMFHAYFITGITEVIGCFIMWFTFMYLEGGLKPMDLIWCYQKWTDGYKGKTQAELDDLLFRGQCVYFVTLVTMQMFNLLATRTRRLSFFQHSPFNKANGNPLIFPAIGVSMIFCVLIVHLPIIQSIFNTRAIPVMYWFIPIGWGVLYFVIDELRKVLVRSLPWWFARRIFW